MTWVPFTPKEGHVHVLEVPLALELSLHGFDGTITPYMLSVSWATQQSDPFLVLTNEGKNSCGPWVCWEMEEVCSSLALDSFDQHSSTIVHWSPHAREGPHFPVHLAASFLFMFPTFPPTPDLQT